MRIFDNGYDRVECFDEKVWIQERQIVKFHHYDEEDKPTGVNILVVYGSTRKRIAIYALDEYGKAVIDVTDILRTYNFAQRIEVECTTDDEIEIPFSIAGLINPASVLIPYNTAKDLLFSIFGYQGPVIVPPQRMLQNIDGALNTCEFFPDSNTPELFYYYISETSRGEDVGVTQQTTLADKQSLIFTFNDEKSEEEVQRVAIAPLVCGVRYAAVRWVSFTGSQRCHTFEVVRQKNSVSDVVSFITVDNTYNGIKGREDGFVLRLDGLNQYDYWYYSDVITSQKVEVSFDGNEWVQVEVISKESTIPDGNAGKFNTLEIPVNWKKYDAFNL